MIRIKKYAYMVLLLVVSTMLFLSITIHAWQYNSNKVAFKNTIKQNIGFANSAKPIQGTIFAYRFYGDTISAIHPLIVSYPTEVLNDTSLLVRPGIYTVLGKQYDLRVEGLYRFMQSNQKNRQLIVSNGDVISLLSAASWIITHGTRDNKYSFSKWYTMACEGKLVVTCSRAALFTHEILKRFNIESRKVHCRTDKASNQFFNAHVMLEVFHPTQKYWFVVDVDNNRYFTKEDKPITMMAFYDYLQNDIPYNWVSLSKDANLDTQGENGLMNENLLSESALHDWYKYVTDQVVIENYSPMYSKL
jgi:hypothetical protein